MNNSINPLTVKHLLLNEGIYPREIKQLSGGSNHVVFTVVQESGERLVVKFPHVREMERKYLNGHQDTLFGGELSPARETFLLDHIRSLGLPTPKVHAVIPSQWGEYIILEHAPGQNMMDYMASKNHSLISFLNLMRCLGEDLRRLHQVEYPSFGNIMEGKRIAPEGIDNFADRYLAINQRILDICHDKGGLNDPEKAMLETYFNERFKQYRSQLSKFHRPPTLVITDLHGGNFFAENDIISSFFDVESAQAAPREFEIYALRFFVFNYYGASEQRLAEKAFWTAYYEREAEWPDEETNELIDFFSVCRLLEVFQSYWGIKDGLRDTWGQRIKAIFLDHVHGGSLDYLRLGDIWRERDLQPKYAVVES